MRAGKIVTALALAAVVTAGRGVSAHRLDECLQAARIAVEPTHIELELDLTPGIAVADAIISEIDRDRDGSLSADEKQTYARRVLAAIDLENDERPLDVKPGATTFAALDSLRRGEGMIRVRVIAALPNQSSGMHHVFFRNRYRPDVSVYLANALVPESAQVAVTGQRHEEEQRELTIDYALRVEQSASMLAWILAIGGGISALTALLKLSSKVARAQCGKARGVFLRPCRGPRGPWRLRVSLAIRRRRYSRGLNGALVIEMSAVPTVSIEMPPHLDGTTRQGRPVAKCRFGEV